MRGNWRLTRMAGIDISVHWSFGLLLLWVGMAAASAGLARAAWEVIFVVAVFGCVVLHELGHALAARRCGIRTRGITLYPIGGVAQLERMPRRSIQELFIALAGPAVNVMIAALLIPITLLLGGMVQLNPSAAFAGSFLSRLLAVNIALVVFNLIPAFPMDGGRVLRSLLAIFADYETATWLAVRVGQGFAILLAGLAFVGNPLLLLIGGFVFLAAEAELRSVREESRQRVLSEWSATFRGREPISEQLVGWTVPATPSGEGRQPAVVVITALPPVRTFATRH